MYFILHNIYEIQNLSNVINYINDRIYTYVNRQASQTGSAESGASYSRVYPVTEGKSSSLAFLGWETSKKLTVGL